MIKVYLSTNTIVIEQQNGYEIFIPSSEMRLVVVNGLVKFQDPLAKVFISAPWENITDENGDGFSNVTDLIEYLVSISGKDGTNYTFGNGLQTIGNHVEVGAITKNTTINVGSNLLKWQNEHNGGSHTSEFGQNSNGFFTYVFNNSGSFEDESFVLYDKDEMTQQVYDFVNDSRTAFWMYSNGRYILTAGDYDFNSFQSRIDISKTEAFIGHANVPDNKGTEIKAKDNKATLKAGNVALNQTVQMIVDGENNEISAQSTQSIFKGIKQKSVDYNEAELDPEWTPTKEWLNNNLNLTSPIVLTNDDPSVYAGESKAVQDPLGISGWHYENPDEPQDKINWYYVNNAGQSSDQELSDIKGMYAVLVVYSDGTPFFHVYTKRKNDGQDYSWYRSRVTYSTLGLLTPYINQRVLLYWGKDPKIYSDLPRVEMQLDPFSTFGPQDPDEEIFLMSLSTSTNYPETTYEFTAQALGFIEKNNEYNFPLVFQPSLTALQSEVNEMGAFLNAVETGRFFRGYVSDQTEMDALSNPKNHEYVARIDTETIWEYNGTSWVDTLVEASITGIAQADQQAAGYSNTHYIDLDGTNDFVDLQNGVNPNVLDYTKTWALSFEVESVDPIDDSTYVTLWKRGNNELTLRKGGTNWGIYGFANGNSIGQANTWRRPQIGSKILFICNGTQLKYYLYLPSNGEIYNATMTLNQTNVANHNNPSGNLQIGNGGVRGTNWYGGINNALIMEGAGSDLGSNQRVEYFSSQDVTLMSFYEDPHVQDFLTLGEGVYPNVSGTKEVISGELVNGTQSDFVER